MLEEHGGMAQLVADRSLAGSPVAAVSLGGAMLGGVPEHEARAILQLAAERGVRLVERVVERGGAEKRGPPATLEAGFGVRLRAAAYRCTHDERRYAWSERRHA